MVGGGRDAGEGRIRSARPGSGRADAAGDGESTGRDGLSYRENVHLGLDAAWERAADREVTLDVDDLRCVIFSDHHRGCRDRGDDFLRSERAYAAALGYYLEAGYRLFLLGDCEELWSTAPRQVLRAHRNTLELEAEFYRDDRYLRLWGNHDDLWENESACREFLDPLYPGLEVREGLRIRLTDGGRPLGRIFLVHGHQGATFSDRHRRVSRVVLRHLWGPGQRFFRQASSTPSHDLALREKHDAALYHWAESREKLILVTGHTHRPVFMSESELGRARRDLRAARDAGAVEPGSRVGRRRVAELRARMEWIRAKSQMNGVSGETCPRRKPCYFNSGCCSYADGDITGIEIVDRQIRLVRWPDREGEPRPHPLATADLARDVFELL